MIFDFEKSILSPPKFCDFILLALQKVEKKFENVMARQTVSFLSQYFWYLHYVPPQNINNLSFLAFSVKRYI